MTTLDSSISVPQKKRWKLNGGYVFVAPAVIYIVALVFLPTIRVANLSLSETLRFGGGTRYAGLDNFATIVNDPVFRRAVVQTFHWAVFTTLGHLTFGFFLALAMNSTLVHSKIRGLCRALILLPWALMPVVVAILIQLWAHPLISPVAKILKALGSRAEFLPLGHPGTAMWALIAVQVWQFTPFFMLMILAGLQSMDPELQDAAQVDGASWLQRTWYVTLPHLREQLITLALFDIVTLAAYFDLIWVATEGGPVRSTEVVATYIFRDAFLGANWNVASAAGMVLLLLLVIVAAIMMTQLRDE